MANLKQTPSDLEFQRPHPYMMIADRRVDDLSQLDHLTEDNLVSTLEQRYADSRYYTYIGDVTIAINPYKKLKIYGKKYHERYHNVRARSDQPAHIFWVADRAYQRMLETKSSQTVLISGDSGAGKTESAKLLIQHIAHICSNHVENLNQKIIEANPLLEAFGNAKTLMNENSSRFGKYVELQMTREGVLVGAEISHYLLEKSRVVRRGLEDGNFHIFYYFLMGLPDDKRDKFHLDDGRRFRIMEGPYGERMFGSPRERDLCTEKFQNVENTMRLLGMRNEDILLTFVILSSVLHLTNIEFEEDEGMSGGVRISTEETFQNARELLFVDEAKFRQVLTEDVHSNFGRQDENIVRKKNTKAAEDTRDALAKALYEKLFSWLVSQVNNNLKTDRKSRRGLKLGILDMSGFENFPTNGFEQLLINVANERLQYFFNEHLFSQDQQELAGGGIDWTKIKYENNGPILDLFLGNRSDGQMGLLEILEEESHTAQATDENMVRRFHRVFSSNKYYHRTHKGDRACFGIRHYAGLVTYDADGFLEKNRDPLSQNVIDCMRASTVEHIRNLFSEEIEARSFSSVASLSRSTKKRSVSQSFTSSLMELTDKLATTRPLFVKCINPNTAQEPMRFDTLMVREQMRYNGLLEVAKIRKIGYPVRMERLAFVDRYRMLVFEQPVLQPTTENCDRILGEAGIKDARVGEEKIFLKEWHRDALERQLKELNDRTAIIQKHYRGYVTRKKFRTLVLRARKYARIRLAEERRKNAVASVQSRKKTKSVSPEARPVSLPPASIPPSSRAPSVAPTEDTVPPYTALAPTPAPAPMMNHVPPKTKEAKKKEAEAKAEEEEEEEDSDLDDDGIPSDQWNIFRVIPRERVSATERLQNILRVIKVILYLVLFGVFLTCLVLNKISLLMLTTSLEVARNKEKLEGVTEVSSRWRNSWVTILMLCMILPHALSFIVFLFKALFGSQPWPKALALVQILVMESFQTVGKCILVFIVLPKVDMIRAVFLMNAACIVPAFCKIAFGRPPKFGPTKDHRGLLTDPTEPGDDTQTNATTDDSERRQEELERAAKYNKMKRIVWYICNFAAFIIQATGIIILLFGQFESTNIGMQISGRFYERSSSVAQSESGDDEGANATAPSSTPSTTTGFPQNILFRHISWSSMSIDIDRWTFPVGLLLVSMLWWENFIDKNISICGGKLKIPLRDVKAQMHILRQKTTVIANLWSIGIIIAFPYVFLESFHLDIYIPDKRRKDASAMVIEYLPALVQTMTGLVGFISATLACKLCMQTISFNLPLALATPVTVLVLGLQCRLGYFDYEQFIWYCPEGFGNTRTSSTTFWHMMCCILWWVSELIIAGHIWWPKQNTMDKTEKLFVTPFYSSILLEQSMLFNRRRNDAEVRYNSRGIVDFILEDAESKKLTKDDDEMEKALAEEDADRPDDIVVDIIPTIYACATMWHETKNEMTQLMKSVFSHQSVCYRMDKDQCARRNLREQDPSFHDPDYYEFETHVLFDDAMEMNENEEFIPNGFVKQFVTVIDEAGSSVHKAAITLEPPERTPTPYGGRLTWKLPGGTLLIAHLKDKNKIRHKKRWSQCMYMYYLLGYRLCGLQEKYLWRGKTEGGGAEVETKAQQQKRMQRKETQFAPGSIFKYLPEDIARQAANTFILALDGDVDFKPDAVRLLVDLLKKNKKVGAACGRIHPIGRGPMVWYQDFEYAISHWLQKAAEHVYGCVLCSPGCFSLFRGAALMDDNVMRRYCVKASAPVEHVQFDQGEDRWLCTLMLQQGYRVEYSAASDALTYAPETFHEFYNQRRRWGPSTMLNVIDLLSTYQNTVRRNDNISYLFMIYQFLLFATSIVGPGTVLMMIAGSFNAVLGTNLWQSYLIALSPSLFYTIVCFTTRGDTQILVAMFMSAVYAVVMMIVIVGTIVNAFQESITSPNVIFLISLAGFYALGAILHPQELFCAVPGLLYFLCIPSGYLLLQIYSICNLNVVSWGTREVATKKSKEEIAREKAEEEERVRREKLKKKGLLSWLGLDGMMNDLKELYSSMLLGKRSGPETVMAGSLDEVKQSMTTLSERLDAMEGSQPRNELREILRRKQQGEGAEKEVSKAIKTAEEEKEEEELPMVKRMKRDDLVNPVWMEDVDIGDGDIKYLNARETKFWKQLLKLYLHPLDKDKKKEKQDADDLASLRNNIVFGYMMLNFLWIVLIFQLQLLKETLEDDFFVAIPRLDDPEGEPDRFEPLGLVFLTVFASILLIQFSATIIHRWGTFLHIIARTTIYQTEDTLAGKLKLVEKLQSIGDILEDDEFNIPQHRTGDSEMGPDSGLYQSLDSLAYDSRPRHRRQRSGYASDRDSHADSKGGTGGTADGGDSHRTRHGHRRHRRRRRKHQQRGLGNIPVAANTLSRNFQRRYGYLKEQVKRQRDHNPQTSVNVANGGAARGEERRSRKRDIDMSDIYRSVRESRAGQYSRIGGGGGGGASRPTGSEVYSKYADKYAKSKSSHKEYR